MTAQCFEPPAFVTSTSPDDQGDRLSGLAHRPGSTGSSFNGSLRVTPLPSFKWTTFFLALDKLSLTLAESRGCGPSWKSRSASTGRPETAGSSPSSRSATRLQTAEPSTSTSSRLKNWAQHQEVVPRNLGPLRQIAEWLLDAGGLHVAAQRQGQPSLRLRSPELDGAAIRGTER